MVARLARRLPWSGLAATLAATLLCAALPAAGGAAHAQHGAPAAEAPARAARPERPQLGTTATFADDGTLFAVLVEGGHVLLHRSDDRGRSWHAPVRVNAEAEPISADGENRPKIVALPGGRLVVSWSRRLGRQYAGEVRIARSDDGGRSFSAPRVVHGDRQEIGHSFESLIVDRQGRLHVFWLDKRDGETARLAARPYRGSAVYFAVSDDGGASFHGETRLADHSCECCRIATALDVDGRPLVLWRHVFAPNERDHALASIAADGTPGAPVRATFDRWRVDGCPHHGPALAVTADGTRHAVWFNQRSGEDGAAAGGRVFHGRLAEGRVLAQRSVGGERAAHADIGAAGQQVAIVWKEFDGERTQLHAEIAVAPGAPFAHRRLAATERASDQPRVIRHGDALFAFWRTEADGLRLFPLSPDAASEPR